MRRKGGVVWGEQGEVLTALITPVFGVVMRKALYIRIERTRKRKPPFPPSRPVTLVTFHPWIFSRFTIRRYNGPMIPAIHQCAPEIHVSTPKGEGHCLFLIDYGTMINTVWVVHLFEDGRVLHFDSSDIKVFGNAMYGIRNP